MAITLNTLNNTYINLREQSLPEVKPEIVIIPYLPYSTNKPRKKEWWA